MFTIEKVTGGLNNQKLSLLGLITAAQDKEGQVSLPQEVHDWTPTPAGRGDTFIPISYAYNLDAISNYVQLSDAPADQVLTFAECFGSGSQRVRAEGGAPTLDLIAGETAAILSAIRPAADIEQEAVRLASVLPAGCAAVQLRVERDWAHHLKSKLARGQRIDKGRELITEPKRVFQKIRNQESLAEISDLLVCCDEEDLTHTKQEIRNFGKEFRINVIFKSEVSEAFPSSRLKRSMLDFEICLFLETYIGLSLSTFSNILSVIKACRVGMLPEHYIYDADGEMALKRRDCGRYHTPVDIIRAAPFAPQ